MTELVEIEFDENIVNKFLDIDGSLRDIYVNDTDINDWILIYSSLLKSEYSRVSKYSRNISSTNSQSSGSSISKDCQK